MPDFNLKKFHDRIKLTALTYIYTIYPVAFIDEVDNEKRRIVKENGSRFITMLNYGDIYLLIFKKKKGI